MDITIKDDSSLRTSPRRSLSPFSARFAFSWHRAAQETGPPQLEPSPAATSAHHTRPATAADEGKQERLADYLHSRAGPLEEGLVTARSNALLLNTPDPLRMDPMCTLGSARHRRRSTSSEELLPPQPRPPRCEKDPLNKDPVQYAASPVRRMETVTNRRRRPPQPSPVEAAGPIQAASGAPADVAPAAEAAFRNPAGNGGLSAAEKSAIEAFARKHEVQRKENVQDGQAQANFIDRKSGKHHSGKAFQRMHRAESCSPRILPAGRSEHAGVGQRMQVEDCASSCSMLSSSSSLDVYQMLKARSRRKQRKHLKYSKVSSPASASSCSAFAAEVSFYSDTCLPKPDVALIEALESAGSL